MKDILNALYHQKDLNDEEVQKLFTLIINEKVSPA
ncbi:anthranilate phosphoribosyltransferase, partial [Helicobacter pylori]|nr:anthranilate phosphoribosyltransferase [Helicobacter pylori]